jgi:hypothetical protein
MSRPIVRIYQGEGQFIDREMNDEEYEQHLKDVEQFEIKKAEAEAKAQAKATAEAKLAALGLTTEDLKALGL